MKPPFSSLIEAPHRHFLFICGSVMIHRSAITAEDLEQPPSPIVVSVNKGGCRRRCHYPGGRPRNFILSSLFYGCAIVAATPCGCGVLLSSTVPLLPAVSCPLHRQTPPGGWLGPVYKQNVSVCVRVASWPEKSRDHHLLPP